MPPLELTVYPRSRARLRCYRGRAPCRLIARPGVAILGAGGRERFHPCGALLSRGTAYSPQASVLNTFAAASIAALCWEPRRCQARWPRRRPCRCSSLSASAVLACVACRQYWPAVCTFNIRQLAGQRAWSPTIPAAAANAETMPWLVSLPMPGRSRQMRAFGRSSCSTPHPSSAIASSGCWQHLWLIKTNLFTLKEFRRQSGFDGG
jgi:hypothetical protein